MITVIGLPWLVVGGILNSKPLVSENEIQNRILIVPMLLLAFLLAFFQLVLAPGVTF